MKEHEDERMIAVAERRGCPARDPGRPHIIDREDLRCRHCDRPVRALSTCIPRSQERKVQQ